MFEFYVDMHVISKSTLVAFWNKEPLAEQGLRVWYDQTTKTRWKSPSELKNQFRSASIISNKRVVFNIHGNMYRLIVDIEYRLQLIFVVWVGTHKAYDLIDVRKVKYVKAD